MSETPPSPKPTIEVEQLAEHAGFVRALARSMLGANRGDDVAQQTIAAALERPPPRPGALRAWLATVTRRLVRRELRDDDRRVRREQFAASRQAASPAASVAARSAAETAVRMETMRRLLAALAVLPEPDRVVLVKRFYDALPPRRIASVLGVPVNTVRTRLQRALERLRAAYFGAEPEGREQRHLGLLVIAAPPIWLVPMGAMVLKKSAAIAVLLVVAAGIVAWQWRERTPALPTSSAASPSPATGVTAASDRPEEAAAAERAESTRVEPTSKSTPMRFVHLRGRICDRAGNVIRPEGGVAVLARYFRPRAATAWSGGLGTEMLAAEVAPDGTFEARVAASAEGRGALARIEVRHAPRGFLDVRRSMPIPDASAWPERGDLELDCELVALRAAVISGRVVDERGDSVNELVASLFRREGPNLVAVPGSDRFTRDGRFLLATAAAGRFELLITPPHLDEFDPTIDRTRIRALGFLPIHRALELRADEAVDLGDVVVAPGETIRGRIVVDPPWSAGEAFVRATRQDPRDEERSLGLGTPWQSPVLLPGFERAAAAAWTDADGEFEIVGLTPGRWFLGIESLGGVRVMADLKDEGIVESSAPSDDVELSLGGALVRVEARNGGKPLAGASIVVNVRGPGRSISMAAGSGGRNVTDGAGRGVVAVPAKEPVTVSASRPGFTRASRSLGELVDGQVVDVALDLEPLVSHPSLIVTVRTAAGLAIERCGFVLSRQEQETPVGTFFDEHGRFVLSDLKPGPWTLRARPGSDFEGGDGFFGEVAHEVEVVDGEVRDVDLVAQPAGRLRVSTRRADGTPIAARCEIADPTGGEVKTTLRYLEEDDKYGVVSMSEGDHVLGEGECTVDPPLAPGRYVATLTLAGFATTSIPFTIAASRCTTLDVILERE